MKAPGIHLSPKLTDEAALIDRLNELPVDRWPEYLRRLVLKGFRQEQQGHSSSPNTLSTPELSAATTTTLTPEESPVATSLDESPSAAAAEPRPPTLKSLQRLLR